MAEHRGDLWIANTVADLIQGDVHEHLPLEAIPLKGDVLGLGTTTSIDNGELSFLPNASGNTTIWKCQASDGGIRALRSGDGSAHFPYVCFSSDVSALKVWIEPQELGRIEGRLCQCGFRASGDADAARGAAVRVDGKRQVRSTFHRNHRYR